jgi:hypothetical protein
LLPFQSAIVLYRKQVFFDTQHEIPKVIEFVEFRIAENEEVFCTAMVFPAASAQVRPLRNRHGGDRTPHRLSAPRTAACSWGAF